MFQTFWLFLETGNATQVSGNFGQVTVTLFLYLKKQLCSRLKIEPPQENAKQSKTAAASRKKNIIDRFDA